MNREETLKHPKCPQWLKDADWGGNVEVIYGELVWHHGVWHGGEWLGGIWCGGVWRGGIWHRGIWRGGTWRGGTWRGGTWHHGEWRGGTWCGGTWCGGEWHDGIWCYGKWRGGNWKRGEWRDGISSITRTKYIPIIHSSGDIEIGCETKSAKEWLKWLDSGKEYETPRDSKEWLELEEAIRVACFKVELLEKRKNEK